MTEPHLQYYRLGDHVTAFSTMRQGGCSEGRYGEFNINRYCGDSEEAIRKNRTLLCKVLGVSDEHLLMPHQVHLAKTAVVDDDFLQLTADEQQARLEGFDALMTAVPEVCIGVSTADCVPVLLYDRRQRAAAAIHAGWRGTVQRIVEKTLAQMMAVYGSQATDITAQIGPCIHLESFEVGDEVYQAFETEGFPMPPISRKYEKWHIDLPACNRQQLLAGGVPASNIHISPVCTFQQSESYFSARRLGINSGRIYTGIVLRAAESL